MLWCRWCLWAICSLLGIRRSQRGAAAEGWGEVLLVFLTVFILCFLFTHLKNAKQKAPIFKPSDTKQCWAVLVLRDSPEASAVARMDPWAAPRGQSLLSTLWGFLETGPGKEYVLLCADIFKLQRKNRLLVRSQVLLSPWAGFEQLKWKEKQKKTQRNSCVSAKLYSLQTLPGAHQRTAPRCSKGEPAAVNPEGFGYSVAVWPCCCSCCLCFFRARF